MSQTCPSCGDDIKTQRDADAQYVTRTPFCADCHEWIPGAGRASSQVSPQMIRAHYRVNRK